MFSDQPTNGAAIRLAATLSGFVTVAVLLLPHIGESRAKAATETAQPPGNVMIEARWPDGVDADVDLWVQAPGDVPVGYSNKGGAIFKVANMARSPANLAGTRSIDRFITMDGKGLQP
jgi:hypothetical protein